MSTSINHTTKRKTEYADFKQRFVHKQLERGFEVYTLVPHLYWCSETNRMVNGKIDVVCLSKGQVTAYELLTTKTERKARDKLAKFKCDHAYLIWHDGKSFRVR